MNNLQGQLPGFSGPLTRGRSGYPLGADSFSGLGASNLRDTEAETMTPEVSTKGLLLPAGNVGGPLSAGLESRENDGGVGFRVHYPGTTPVQSTQEIGSRIGSTPVETRKGGEESDSKQNLALMSPPSTSKPGVQAPYIQGLSSLREMLTSPNIFGSTGLTGFGVSNMQAMGRGQPRPMQSLGQGPLGGLASDQQGAYLGSSGLINLEGMSSKVLNTSTFLGNQAFPLSMPNAPGESTQEVSTLIYIVYYSLCTC